MIAAKAAGAHGMFVVGFTFELIAAQMDQHAAAQLATMAATLEEPLQRAGTQAGGPVTACELAQASAFARFLYFDRMREAVSILPDWVVRLLPADSASREALAYFGETRDQYRSSYGALARNICVPPSSEPAGAGGDCSAGQDIALILDSSGSMRWNDPQGLRRDAGSLFVDRAPAGARIAAIDFDDGARLVAPLGTDRDPVRRALQSVDADGGTDITRALSAGLDVLSSGGGARAALLFTDGQSSQQEGGAAYARAGIPVHVVGLGSGVNSEFLTRLASETGGVYLQAGQARDLMGAFDQIIADLSCEGTVLSRRATLLPGQTAEFPFVVDSYLSGFTCRLTWSGSQFGLEVRDPTGAPAGSPAGSGSTYAMVRVDAARPGVWTARVTAVDVPGSGEECMLRIGGASDLRVSMATSAVDPTILRLALNTPDPRIRPNRQWSRIVGPDGTEVAGPEPRAAADGAYEVFVPVSDVGVYAVTAGLAGGSGAGEWSREITRTVVVGEGAIAWRGVIARIEGAYATLNRGARHGMRPGLEVAIGAPGQPAARGHIISVLATESTLEVEELFGGALVREGMPFEVNVRQWMGDAAP